MSIIDLVFPKSCLGCGKDGVYICDSCTGKVPLLGWHSGSVFSVWRYKGVIRQAILALKYKYSTEIAKEIAIRTVNLLKKREFKTKDIVLIPVPLFRVKQNLRGFNQSEEIGKLVAKEMNWGFAPNLLIKKKQTKSQVELRGSERRENLKGVFELNSNVDLSTLKGKTILIFDDVYTTGSTLKEASEVIKNKELKKIYGLTIAR